MKIYILFTYNSFLLYCDRSTRQQTTREVGMPPSGFSTNTIKGLLAFVKGNYEDLREEVRSGKHPSVEVAIDYEIAQLGKALEKLHLDEEGNIVDRAT